MASLLNKATSTATGCGLIGGASAFALALLTSKVNEEIARVIHFLGVPIGALSGIAYISLYNEFNKYTLGAAALFSAYAIYNQYNDNQYNDNRCNKDPIDDVTPIVIASAAILGSAISEIGQYTVNCFNSR